MVLSLARWAFNFIFRTASFQDPKQSGSPEDAIHQIRPGAQA